MISYPYRGMDRTSLDLAYNNVRTEPDYSAMMTRFKEQSEVLYHTIETQRDIAYGSRSRHRFDWLSCGRSNAPTFVRRLLDRATERDGVTLNRNYANLEKVSEDALTFACKSAKTELPPGAPELLMLCCSWRPFPTRSALSKPCEVQESGLPMFPTSHRGY